MNRLQQIRDVLVNVMFKQAVNNQSVNLDIDIAKHPKGIYFVKVQSADKVYTEKIIIQ